MEAIQSPSMIYEIASSVVRTVQTKFFRDGIEMEKGAVITKKRIEENRELYEQWCEYFINYPDIYLDVIKRKDSQFNLFYYQRLFIRLCMRYGRLLVIAPRAFSKSFISILALYLACIFRPGIKLFICAKIAPYYCEIIQKNLFNCWNILISLILQY